MLKTDDIVIGTCNRNKKEEIRAILKSTGVRLLDLDQFENHPDIIEDGVTFEENAIKKALELAGFCKMCVMADDSGLEIDALGKKPGVMSSRYYGVDTGYEEKCSRLLDELDGIPFEKRTARFRCAIALAEPDKLQFVVEASCEGVIHTELRGGNGFGYDPIFYVPEYHMTMAEMGTEEKNRISHRARALTLFRARLKELV